jgi:hypothetical protein
LSAWINTNYKHLSSPRSCIFVDYQLSEPQLSSSIYTFITLIDEAKVTTYSKTMQNDQPAIPPASVPRGGPVPLEHHVEIHYPDLALLKEGESVHFPEATTFTPKFSSKKQWASTPFLSKVVTADKNHAGILADMEPSAVQELNLGRLTRRTNAKFVNGVSHAVDYVGQTFINMLMIQGPGKGQPLVRLATQTTFRIVVPNAAGTGFVDKHVAPTEITLNPVWHTLTEQEWVNLAAQSRMPKKTRELWYEPLENLRTGANLESWNLVGAALTEQRQSFKAQGKQAMENICENMIAKMMWDMFLNSIEQLSPDRIVQGESICSLCKCVFGHGCNDPVYLLCPSHHIIGFTCLKLALFVGDSNVCPICDEDIPKT